MHAGSSSSEAQRKFKEYQDMYSHLVGKRVVYHSKAERDSHVCTVKGAYDRYVMLEYKCYNLEKSTPIKICCMYSSLISGEDKVVVD